MAKRALRGNRKARDKGDSERGLLFFALCGKSAADGTLYSCKLEGEPTGKPMSKRKRFYKQFKIIRI